MAKLQHFQSLDELKQIMTRFVQIVEKNPGAMVSMGVLPPIINAISKLAEEIEELKSSQRE
jgi:hypothetical protein